MQEGKGRQDTGTLGIIYSMFLCGPRLGVWNAESANSPHKVLDAKTLQAVTGSFGEELGPKLNPKGEAELALGRERHLRRQKSMSKDKETQTYWHVMWRRRDGHERKVDGKNRGAVGSTQG